MVKADPNLSVIMIAWSPNRWFSGFNDKKSPFGTNVKLRQATQYATDRESLAKVIGFGTGWPGFFHGWIPAWSGYDESLPKYTFDLNKAQQLVKESGVQNPQLEYLHYVPTTHKQVAEILQQMWSQAGIKMVLMPAEQAAARDKVKSGEFDFSAWTMAPSPDPAHYERMFTCAGAANWSNYCNKEMDKCMFDAQAELDPAKRAEQYKKCQKIVYEDAQLSNMFNTALIETHRKEVKNLKMQIHSRDVQEVWLDK
jgi:ABC-type transport system substrate-binding protein